MSAVLVIMCHYSIGTECHVAFFLPFMYINVCDVAAMSCHACFIPCSQWTVSNADMSSCADMPFADQPICSLHWLYCCCCWCKVQNQPSDCLPTQIRGIFRSPVAGRLRQTGITKGVCRLAKVGLNCFSILVSLSAEVSLSSSCQKILLCVV